MKKAFAFFISIAGMFAVALPLMAATETVNGITWTYQVEDGQASLGYDAEHTAVPISTTGAITIPSTLGGYSVTHIMPYAFKKCSGLTSVTISDSVTSIGSCAFLSCTGLTSVTISDSVTSIYSGAFSGCRGLTSVMIPDSVTSIESAAFEGCSGLTSVTIPDGVTKIGASAFADCSDLLFDTTTIPGVKLVDGWAVGNTGSLSGALDLTGVRGIGGRAFYNRSGLTNVTIPNSVTSIGESAFYGCSGLTSVTIPNSVTSIGESAFYGCSGLTSVAIGNSVTHIGFDAFRDCSGLTSVTIPNSVTSIGQSAFYGCSGLTAVHINDLVAWCRIVFSDSDSNPLSCAHNFYLNGERIVTLTIPEGITVIRSYAFSYCSGLKSVVIPDSVTRIELAAFEGSIGSLFDTTTIPGVKLVDGWAVSNTGSLSGALDLTGIRGIGERAFYNCSGLTSVTIPNSVTGIGSSAFYGCSGLTSVTIPNSVTSIGDNAFSGCSGLTSVTIPNGVTSIGGWAFSGCRSLTSVTIPDSVKSIESEAFSGCRSLKSVAIGSGMTSIAHYAFDGCNGSLFDTTTIPGVKLVDGWAVGNTGYPSGALDLTGVRGIGDYAFYGCSGLTSVTIPNGVTSIGGWAFCDCSSLWGVTIPDSVTSIGRGSFDGCRVSLFDTITIPGVKLVDGWAIGNTGSLSGALDLTGVRGIGGRAFHGCSRLASVTLPASVKSIGSYAFYYCSGLTSVTISDGVTSIGNSAFEDCSGLTNMVFEGNAPEVGYGAFVAVAPDCHAYVRRDSTGWGVEIPGAWNGLAIDYLSEVEDQYVVIDLSGGPNAISYPVSYLSNVPIGGWTDEYKTTKLVLRKIPEGSFMMGGTKKTTISKPFYIGVFEVTQRQWELVMGNKPSYFNNTAYYATRPVEQVSYNMIRGSFAGAGWPESSAVDGESFLGKLRERTDFDFDLPTEARWEYACHAGTTSKYNNGGDSEEDLKRLGRYRGNGGSDYNQDSSPMNGTAKVGSYASNAWRLYDMHGNVAELCLDWYGDTLAGGIDPLGPDSGLYWPRVYRGGSLVDGFNSDVCSSLYRANCYYAPSDFSCCVGFRLCSALPHRFSALNIEMYLVTNSVVYTGNVCELDIESVMFCGTLLTESVDYLVSYSDNENAGMATITLMGINLYDGTFTTNFTIRPRPLTQGMVGAIGNHPYTGKAQTPKPTVTDAERGATLREGVEYTLSYANNTAIGEGIVTVTGKGNYTGSIARAFVIEPSAGSELEERLGGAGKAESDGTGGWIVTLTNDVDSADLPMEIPDNLGNVTIDLNGHDFVGPDGKPAIRIVPGDDDVAPTQLTIINSADGNTVVQGGEGAPAIEVADGVQDGVLVNIGEGVTVQGGGDDVPAIIGDIGTNEGSIERVNVEVPSIASAEYTGNLQMAVVPDSSLYNIVQNDGGVIVGEYPVKLSLTDTNNYCWAGGDLNPTSLTFTISQATNAWITEPTMAGWICGQTPSEPNMGEAKFGTATVTYSGVGGGQGAARPTEPGEYVVVFAVEETANWSGLTKDMPFKITAAEETRLEAAFDGLPVSIESDGEGGWIVTITNDIDSADLPIEIPDNIGNVTIDLNGHDLMGGDGRDGARPSQDAQPAIRIVPVDGDGEPTQITIVNSGDDATVQGGEGAPAIEVIDGVRDGVVVDVGDGVTVKNGYMPPEVTLKVGEYFKATLAELGYDVPTNGTPYSVVAKGLPAGLKLKYNAAWKNKKGKVVIKAKSEWWIEGVPTAALDFITNPPYLVITANSKTVTEPLPIEVLAQEVTVLEDLALGQSVNEQFYLPGVTNGWTVSGLPTGLKYNAKRLTEKLKSGKKTMTVTKALPYSVYGKTTKAGLFTITAKKKVGAYYETMKYRVLVTPATPVPLVFGEELTNITTMAYVPVKWDLLNGGEWDGGHAGRVTLPPVAAVGGKVAKVAGLPSGVKQYGQTIKGTPTKPGTYVLTFTKNVKSGKKTVAKTAQILWTVVANDAEVELGFNEKGGVIESGVVGLKYGDLMAFSATSNATVTASGLPAGIKLVRLDDGGRGATALPGDGRAASPLAAVWGFKGFTTKAGTYLVTVKATLNGKTVTQRVALKVDALPAWAKGTFNGNVKCRMENGELGEELGGSRPVATNGLATVTVSAAGKISGKFQEQGTNWTLSAACYTAAGTRDACPYQTFVCSNVVAKYSYKVTETVKGKKKTVTKTLTREFALTVSPVPVVPNVPDVPIRGFATLAETDATGRVPPEATEIEAWQNLWGSTYKTLGKKLFTTKSGKKTLAYKTFVVDVYTNAVGAVTFIQKGDEVDKTGLTYFITLSLKVTTSGAVTATLSFDTGKKKKDPKTKKMVAVIYKPTCSTVVIPTSAPDADPFTSGVYVYFAPSVANNFTGFCGWVPLTGRP